MARLTKEQFENNIELVYNFIKQFIKENGYAPVYREIIAGTGIKCLDSINRYLNILKKQDRIDFVPEKARTIRIK